MNKLFLPEQLPPNYQLTWINSPETELITVMMPSLLSERKQITLAGQSDTGRRHLCASTTGLLGQAIRVTDNKLEPASTELCVLLTTSEDQADCVLPLPSPERRLGIVLEIFRHRGIGEQYEAAEILVQRMGQGLTALTGVAFRAADYAILHGSRLDSIHLEEVLCDYDPCH